MLKKILRNIWQLFKDQSGKGGGTTVQKTVLPDPTPEQQEANKLAIELANLQAKELSRRNQLTEQFAPEREALLKSQLQSTQQQLQLGGQAQQGLLESLTQDQYEAQRAQLKDQLAKDTLAKIKGEKSWVSQAEKDKLSNLEKQYVTNASGNVTDLQGELERLGNKEMSAEGLRPSAGVYGLSQEEMNRQVTDIGRQGRLLNLQTQMNLPLENMQNLEGQRQIAEQLGQGAQASDLSALLALAGRSGSFGTTSPTISGEQTGNTLSGGTNLNNIIGQMQAQREAMASQNTYTIKDRGQGAVMGGVTGATLGATLGGAAKGIGAAIASAIGIGAAPVVAPIAATVATGAAPIAATVATGATTGSVLPGIGTLIGAGVGAIAGIIYGYNA